MARMRFFSLPLALKYLKIRSQVPFAFNKILIFFNRGSPKLEVTQFLFKVIYKVTILYKNVQYICIAISAKEAKNAIYIHTTISAKQTNYARVIFWAWI